jgi:hypothetical protein
VAPHRPEICDKKVRVVTSSAIFCSLPKRRRNHCVHALGIRLPFHSNHDMSCCCSSVIWHAAAAQGQPTPQCDDLTAAFSRPPNRAPRTAIITRLGVRLSFAPKPASWSRVQSCAGCQHQVCRRHLPCCEIGLHEQKQETSDLSVHGRCLALAAGARRRDDRPRVESLAGSRLAFVYSLRIVRPSPCQLDERRCPRNLQNLHEDVPCRQPRTRSLVRMEHCSW